MAIPDKQVPAVHHRRIGDIILSSVSDGYLDGSMAVIQNIPEAEAVQLLRDSFRPVPRRTDGEHLPHPQRRAHRAGRYRLAAPPGGDRRQAVENLAALGMEPAEIDTVILTHMHPDHSNGLTDPRDRAAVPECRAGRA